jgi:plastocyanin
MRYSISLAVLATAALVAAGCGSSGGSNSTTTAAPSTTAAAPASTGPAVANATVTIKDFKYGPPTVVVKQGGKVTWKNADTAQHTATASNKAFDTGTLNPGASKAVTLTKAGAYSYTCLFHPFMHGRLVVK